MDEIMATALGDLTTMDRSRARLENLMLKKPAPKPNQKTDFFLRSGIYPNFQTMQPPSYSELVRLGFMDKVFIYECFTLAGLY